MKQQKWEAFEASLTIVGDEAALPGERVRRHYTPDQRRRRRERENEHRRERRANDPAYVEKERAYRRSYEQRPERKAYHREWMWNHRHHPQHPVAALHDLACSGPSREEGCVCQKIPMYSGPAK